jgi:hypothetical protein
MTMRAEKDAHENLGLYQVESSCAATKEARLVV